MTFHDPVVDTVVDVVDVRLEEGNDSNDFHFVVVQELATSTTTAAAAAAAAAAAGDDDDAADGSADNGAAVSGGGAAVILRTTDHNHTQHWIDYYNGKARHILVNRQGYLWATLTSLVLAILIVVSVHTSEERRREELERARHYADDSETFEKWGTNLDSMMNNNDNNNKPQLEIPNIPTVNVTILHHAWTRMGSDLMGPNVSGLWKYDANNFGHHVALSGDGRRVAVAVSMSQDADETVKQPPSLEELLAVSPSSPISTVYVYNYNAETSTWEYDATITPPTELITSNPPSMEELANGNTHEGITMSKDGTRIAFTVSDKVLVYFKLGQYHHSEWKTYGPPIDPYGTGSTLTSSSPAQNDHYTTLAFAVGGDTLLVRGTLATDSSKSIIQTYTCKIYPGDGHGSGPTVSWDAVPGQELIVPSPRGGLSISDDGTRLAVGMPEENGLDNDGETITTMNNGKVQVFDQQGDIWVQVGQDIVGKDAYDRVGETLVLSGNGQRLAVGTPAGNYLQTYELLSTSTATTPPQWVTVGQRLALEHAAFQFGHSVDFSFDSNILAVGAPGTLDMNNNINNKDAEEEEKYRYGAVYVYKYNEVNNEWQLRGNSKITSDIPNDSFGATVSLDFNGNRLVVGAPYREIGNDLVTGVAAVYEWYD